MHKCWYVYVFAAVNVRLVMSSPAKRSQYGYQLGYIFGACQDRGS